MNISEAISKRKSIRKFTDKNLSKEEITKILNAARLAPSGKNSQNWHFIVFTEQNKKEELAEIIKSKHNTIYKEMYKIDEKKAERFKKFLKHFTLFYLNSPVLILVMATDYFPTGYYEYKLFDPNNPILDDLVYKRNPAMQNIGACIENMILQSIELGFGTCWLTSANYAAKEIEEYLSFSEIFDDKNYFMSAMLAIGEAKEPNNSPNKKKLEEIVTWA